MFIINFLNHISLNMNFAVFVLNTEVTMEESICYFQKIFNFTKVWLKQMKVSL